ncbi:MAG: potassium-transporting ATPase subunit KdpA [Actinomycetia bacterium]|nr:potassium-transporting ATPase subunit KdpA [Actinomycetes bacterium]
MSTVIFQDIFFLALLIALAIPLGLYIHQVMDGQKTFMTPVLAPVERLIYRVIGARPDDEMKPKRYAFAVLAFSLVGFLFLFVLLLIQGILPLNPQHLRGVNWHLAFNTTASFISNTNWQAYAGETTLSYLSQSLGLTVQNFVSAAVGISVLFVLIRGFIRHEKETVGNFWADLTRVTLYVLIPLAVIVTVLIASQGVVQTLAPAHTSTTLQSASTVTTHLGPAASQVAIKQLGTNGGGFFGANSAFPLENPTAFSNFIEMFSLLIIPAALCFTFGKAVKDAKQGHTLITVMVVLFVAALAIITISEHSLAPHYAGVIASGNMEGKEVVNGVGASSLWGASTTAASNGAVNATPDSFTALGGMMMMFLMQLGEIVFGGVGSGLYGMIAFVMLTVFIAGLMVGRTPEYLGKKIGPFDMKMVCAMILAPPLLTLIGTAAATLAPGAASWLNNTGAHGFSELLYAFTSMANNNGSAFAGMHTNTAFTNLTGGVIMLLVRFIPIVATIFLAGNLSKKKIVASSEGTLSTSNLTFAGLLIAIILIIGALSFLPSLSLGPIADFFTRL